MNVNLTYEKPCFNKNKNNLRFLTKDKRFKDPNKLIEVTDLEPLKLKEV